MIRPELVDFVRAVERVQADTSRTARSYVVGVLLLWQHERHKLRRQGQLTADVDDALASVADGAMTGFVDISDVMSKELHGLAKYHQPPPFTAADGAEGWTRAKIDNIFNFTMKIGKMEADATLSIHEKGMAVVRQLDLALSTLKSEGELSEEVEEELVKLARTAVSALHELSSEMGSILRALLQTYQPPVTRWEKVRHWWERALLLGS